MVWCLFLGAAVDVIGKFCGHGAANRVIHFLKWELWRVLGVESAEFMCCAASIKV